MAASLDSSGSFALPAAQLTAGDNSLEIVLTSPAGERLVRTIPIRSSGNAPFRVVSQPNTGFAPFQAVLRYAAPWGPPSSIHVSNLGGGVLDTSQSDSHTIGLLSFATAGLYLPTVTINYGEGLTYSQTVAITVLDAADTDRTFQGVIQDFTLALESRNKALAMRQLSTELQSQFEPTIDALLPTMSQIIPTIKGYGPITLDTSFATYAVKRVTGGIAKIFLLDFLQESDGVWRIDSF